MSEIKAEAFVGTNADTALDDGAFGIARTPVATARLITDDGIFLIQERRATPRARHATAPTVKRETHASSPAMMALGGLIIIGVLVGSYTTKYDGAIGHVGGPLPIPAVGFLALQLFLCRTAFRLFCDIDGFKHLNAYIKGRLLRYLPAVIPAVLLGYVVITFMGFPGSHASLTSLPANLAMVADMVGADVIDSSHWRLKIELIQSALVAMIWFSPLRRHQAALLTIGLAICAIFIAGEPGRGNVLTLQGFVTSDGYLPLFVFGAALYQLTQDRSARVWQVMLAASAILAALSNTPAHGVVVLMALAVLTLIAMGHLTALGRVPLLARLGALAFPIYVVHFVTGFALIHRLETIGCSPLVACLVASLVAIGLGLVFNLVFERPAEKHVPAFIAKFVQGFAAALDGLAQVKPEKVAVRG